MIDAYVWTTPNGFKLLIALEELGLPYNLNWVNIGKGEQKTPAYLAINPNHKIPAIVDHDEATGETRTVFESGAALTYLGDRSGKLLPTAGQPRYTALEWMFFNAGGTGPMTGQLYFFTKSANEKLPLAIDRFTDEVKRLHGVLERRLSESTYLVGDEYTLADVMNVTWVKAAADLGIPRDDYPSVKRWVDAIMERDAVKRAYALKPPQ